MGSSWNMEVRSGGCFIRGVKKKGLELEFSKLEFHMVFFFLKSTLDDYCRDKGPKIIGWALGFVRGH